MATIGNKFVDLIDIYKQQNGKGEYIEVIEMLAEMTPILDDAVAVECNSGTRHLHAVRTGLPDITWGRLYQGIPQSKGTQAQVEDTTGFAESLSSVDTRLLKLAKDKGKVRLNEATTHLQAMALEVGSKLFYGNTASDPEEFMGLAPRFSELGAPNGGQIVDAGGTGSDNTSVWFVTWGDSQVQMLFPEGTMAGVQREDMGRQRVLDANTNPYFVEEEMFTWHAGLAVADWRYVARIANIDVSDMEGGAVKLYDFMRKAYYRLWNRRQSAGSIAIYCNRDVMEALDALATNAGSTDNFVRLRHVEIEGQEILMYRGIPIRETDALLNTEARVV